MSVTVPTQVISISVSNALHSKVAGKNVTVSKHSRNVVFLFACHRLLAEEIQTGQNKLCRQNKKVMRITGTFIKLKCCGTFGCHNFFFLPCNNPLVFNFVDVSDNGLHRIACAKMHHVSRNPTTVQDEYLREKKTREI